MGPKQPTAGPSRIKATSTQAPPPPASVAAFNPARTLFACAQPVLGSADKLTVWDVITDRVIAEWEVEGAAKATTLAWSSISSGAARKKRKKRVNAAADGEEDVVVLTTDKGSAIVFTPRRGEVLRRLNLGRVHASAASEDHLVLVTAKEALVLDHDLSAVEHRFPLPAGSPSTAATLLPTSTLDTLHLLIAHSSVVALHLDLANKNISHTSPPLPVSTSSVLSITPLATTPQGSSFLVVSEDDRAVSQYTLSTPTSSAKLTYRYASPTLSPVHSTCVSSDLLLSLHTSGEVSLFSLPKELDFARPKSDSKPSQLKLVEGKEDRLVRLAGVTFIDEGDVAGSVSCGRMVGGGRIKWVRAVYELPDGGVKPNTIVKCDAQDLVGVAAAQNSIPVQRFAAPSTTVEVPAEQDPAPALSANVDEADMSLGERLLALPNGDAAPHPSKTSAPTLDGPVNATSLTRLLVQALHTSDPALLNLCLSHRDPALIRNTIRKMPTQLALPLLKACVERLGQGKASGKRGGGRGVAANEQIGRGTVEWVKGLLVERGSILMTMPSLPMQLTQLSSMLQTRMQLHQPLLALSGRLDLALAQISMRRLAAEQAIHADGNGEGTKYVEGESDSESDDEGVHVEVGDDEGEIEDIDMRDRSESEEDDDEDDEDDSEDDSDEDDDGESFDELDSGSDKGGARFLDLEADEESGSGESDEED